MLKIHQKTNRRTLKSVTVGFKEPVFDLIQARIVVLAALVGDLDGAHDRADAAHRDQVEVV